MTESNISKEAELWGKLYGLLCKWPSVQAGLGDMHPSDQRRLDDLAEQMIREAGAARTCPWWDTGERTMSHEDAVMIAGAICGGAFMVSMFILSGAFFIRDKLDTLFRRAPAPTAGQE